MFNQKTGEYILFVNSWNVTHSLKNQKSLLRNTYESRPESLTQ